MFSCKIVENGPRKQSSTLIICHFQLLLLLVYCCYFSFPRTWGVSALMLFSFLLHSTLYTYTHTYTRALSRMLSNLLWVIRWYDRVISLTVHNASKTVGRVEAAVVQVDGTNKMLNNSSLCFAPVAVVRLLLLVLLRCQTDALTQIKVRNI